MNAPSANVNSTIAVGAGTLNMGSIAIPGSATSGHNCILSVSSGSINCSGDITFSGTTAQAQLNFSGAGFLNITGSFGAGGSFTPSSGTVDYNGAIQTVTPYSYNNLSLSGSGVKTITSVTTINGNFSLSGSATATPGAALTVAGMTTLSETSQLILGTANLLADGNDLTLDGGTFVTGLTTGKSETLATLTLTNSSFLELGSGSHNLNFAASNAVSWSAAKILAISGWTGSYNGTTGTAGKIFFGTLELVNK